MIMENMDDELPTYEDVLREIRAERDKALEYWREFFFKAFDALLTLVLIAVFCVIRFNTNIDVHVVDVTMFCNDSNYKASPYPKLNYAFTNILIAFLLTVPVSITVIKGVIAKYRFGKIIRKVLLEFWTLASHLVCLSVVVDLLKLYSGVIRPYFFSNEAMVDLYCSGERVLFSHVEGVDRELRMSFPSYRAAICGFSLVFFYFFMDHLELSPGIHATQQAATLTMVYYVGNHLCGYWFQGENHFEDIVVGLIFGAIQAMITVRNMYGTVFCKIIPDPQQAASLPEIFPARDSFEMEVLRPNPEEPEDMETTF